MCRMRSANILLISVKALGTEIAKNLILNGIGSLTIVDSEQVTEDDLGAQYFVREENIGRNVRGSCSIDGVGFQLTSSDSEQKLPQSASKS